MLNVLVTTPGAALELPSLILTSQDQEALSVASRIVRVGKTGPPAPFSGPKEIEDVLLPKDSEWGSGRRVAVDRRYDLVTGAMLIRIPDPALSNQPSSSSASSKSIANDEGDCDASDASGPPLHPGAAHAARCAGAVEVMKEFASSWGVDMKRRILVVHLACRLPRQCLGAIRRLSEVHHESTLFVLTFSRPSAVDSGWLSRAVVVPVRPVVPVVASSILSVKSKGKKGSKTTEETDLSTEDETELLCRKVHAMALADASLARLRARGGDLLAARKPYNELVMNLNQNKRL